MLKRTLLSLALGALGACHVTMPANSGGPDLGVGGNGGSGGTGGGGGGGSGGSGGTGGGGGGGGGLTDGGSHTMPDPTLVPKPTGTCPAFADGTLTFSPAGIAPRQARVWMTAAAQQLHGPLVFYWYATTSSTAEVVLYGGLGQTIVDSITAKGGIVVAPVEDMPNGMKNQFPWYLVSGNQMDDLKVADEIVGCAIEKVGIDLRHIHSMGMSAGALQTSRMSYLRSGYLASVATYSGGIDPSMPDAFQDPANLFPAMIFHGGSTDTYGNFSFLTASLAYQTSLRTAGHFAFICDHSAMTPGHHIPPAPASTSVWQFFQDHPFGTNPSPYTGGLPSGFLSYCTIN